MNRAFSLTNHRRVKQIFKVPALLFIIADQSNGGASCRLCDREADASYRSTVVSKVVTPVNKTLNIAAVCAKSTDSGSVGHIVKTVKRLVPYMKRKLGSFVVLKCKLFTLS